MRFRIVITIVVSAFILIVSAQSSAANPGFDLAFDFKPAFGTGTPLAPNLYLDVCANPMCSSVFNTILMHCSVRGAANGSAVAVTHCVVPATFRYGNPEPNMALLSRPVNLRVRANNLVSQTFYFPGGQPNIPRTIYEFFITPSPTGFMVTP